MKSKVEIIKYIKEHFSQNPRSKDGHLCRYNGPNGEHCAFAICCKDPEVLSVYENKRAFDVLSYLGFEILKEEFMVKDPYFWNSIQEFHDDDQLWNGMQLTERGEQNFQGLIKLYEDEKGSN